MPRYTVKMKDSAGTPIPDLHITADDVDGSTCDGDTGPFFNFYNKTGDATITVAAVPFEHVTSIVS